MTILLYFFISFLIQQFFFHKMAKSVIRQTVQNNVLISRFVFFHSCFYFPDGSPNLHEMVVCSTSTWVLSHTECNKQTIYQAKKHIVCRDFVYWNGYYHSPHYYIDAFVCLFIIDHDLVNIYTSRMGLCL